MKNLVLILSFLLATQPAIAEDWKALISQLDKKPQTQSVRKRKAIFCNNLAIEAHQQKDWRQAEKWIQQAIKLDKKGGYGQVAASIYMAQAIESYKQRSNQHFTGYMHRQAKLLAQRALVHDRSRADIHLFIGDIEYENQKLPAAKRAWLDAKKLDPNISGLSKRLCRLETERKIEKQSSKSSNSFFDVSYQTKNLDKKTASGLRLAMTTARDNVGKDFAYRPKHKINVVVYSSDAFSSLRIGPHWAGGLYDGKIRLPLDGKQNLKYAVATLFHEYTHAIIHDLTRGNCPRWLNEGLSEVQGYKIKKESPWALQKAAEVGQCIPLKHLDGAFQSNNTVLVALGYQQAHSVASYLVEKHGYKKVKRLLDELGRETPFEIALRKSCTLSTEELESKWKAWLPSQF